VAGDDEGRAAEGGEGGGVGGGEAELADDGMEEIGPLVDRTTMWFRSMTEPAGKERGSYMLASASGRGF
jgi:hypothetical protein